MTDKPVLIVGAGIAGLSAAIELARNGIASIIADQAMRIGGMIHRQPVPGISPVSLPWPHRRRWAALTAGLELHRDLISIRLQSRFAGIDHGGEVLVTGSPGFYLRPSALIFATGATERILPRPGWTLANVRTAGAIQIGLKTSGVAPSGRIVLAGAGPLLFAVGAQLARAGNEPVAIVQAGKPFAPAHGAWKLPFSQLAEAAGYMATLLSHRVPILTGTDVVRITESGDGLELNLQGAAGERVLSADLVGLHDGIRPNSYGATACDTIPFLSAGDCHEALGADAAALDGEHVARRVMARLGGMPDPEEPHGLARARETQGILARMHGGDEAARLAELPDDTVICRCENRTLADLQALGPAPTTRELRLNGRFAMGACQGRFCGEWVNQLAANNPPSGAVGAMRWPVRPISIADILDAGQDPAPLAELEK